MGVSVGQQNEELSVTYTNESSKSSWKFVVTTGFLELAESKSGLATLKLEVSNDVSIAGETLFRIGDEPSHGAIGQRQDELSNDSSSFSLDAIRNGQVVYLQRCPMEEDKFTIETASPAGLNKLNFSLSPVSHVLNLRQTGSIEVPVGGTVFLEREFLEATAPHNSPEDVLYTTSRPYFGHLYFQSSPETATEVSSFSQSMVNDGRIVYQHSGEEAGEDHFRFNVVDRNGRTLEERKFNIRIVER
jgi:hypothetical protein